MYKRILLAVLASLVLTACSSTDTGAPAVTVANAYVKATDSMMTGAFMEITNNSDVDVTLTGATVDFAERAEVHEVTDGVMRMKEGGLAIPAGQTQVLMPGGNHLMFLGLKKKVVAGEELRFTLEFADGSSVDVTAPVKAVSMGDEKYEATPAPSMSM